MVEYSKVNVKLTDTQLKKLKKALNEIICLKNYYWQQDKKRSQEMHLITLCQLI